MRLLGVSKGDLVMKNKKKLKEESVFILKGLSAQDQQYYINHKFDKLEERRRELID